MILLAIADRAPREKIKTILDKNPVQMICTLGDLDQMALAELEDIHNIPKLGVYGNHCSGMYFEPLGITNMHLKTFEFGGLTFGGFEGCVRYKNDPYAKMYTQEEATELLKDFPHVDIMLVHCPPYGIHDEPKELPHQGYKALREYLEKKKPRYLLHQKGKYADKVWRYRNSVYLWRQAGECTIAMPTDNAQKKQHIDSALEKYTARMAALKQKRDVVVSDFLKVLSEKKIAELRKQLGVS
jgi:uncharacterized protein